MDAVAALLQYLTSQSSHWQGPSLVVVAAEVRAYYPYMQLRVVVCYACAVLKVLSPPVECSTECVG